MLWYPLRVTYSRELLFKEYLDTQNIENFIPMRYEDKMKGGKKQRLLVPVIHNLIFVHSTKTIIDALKFQSATNFPIRYIMDRELGKPITIPEKQMNSFIAVAGTFDEQLIYLDPIEVKLKKGDKVRIKDGYFKDVEGEFLRIKGDRRVVVSIPGIMAVATAFLHPSLIEKI